MATARCGDSGGRKASGELCRTPVRDGGRCRFHPEWPTETDFAAAMMDTGGVLKNVAEAMGVRRSEVEAAIERWPTVRAALQEEQAKVSDLVKERMIEQAAQGNVAALKWCAENLPMPGLVMAPTGSGPEKGGDSGEAWA